MGLRSWSWRRVALLWIAGVVLEVGIVLAARTTLDALMVRSLEAIDDLPGAQRQEVRRTGALDVRDSASIRIYTWTVDSTDATFQRYERLDAWTDWLLKMLPIVVLTIPAVLLSLTVVWFWGRERGGDGAKRAAT